MARYFAGYVIHINIRERAWQAQSVPCALEWRGGEKCNAPHTKCLTARSVRSAVDLRDLPNLDRPESMIGTHHKAAIPTTLGIL
jgi:hypothetical protein